jgi:hypothetical protein
MPPSPQSPTAPPHGEAHSARRRPRPAGRIVCCVVALAALSAAGAQAQRRGAGALSGRVVNRETREPVAGVRVLLVGTRIATFTDSAGRFGMQGLSSGEVNFEARAVGYRMGRWQVVLPVGLEIERVFELEPVNIALDTVTVAAAPDRNWRSAEAFESRRRRGIGYFITKEMIEERQANNITDLLQTVPGLIGTCRAGSCDIQMMASGRNCRPEYYLDGYSATNSTGWDFPARTIGAIEIYRSPHEVPPEFLRSNLRCGVIAIWSRGTTGRQ